MIIETSKIDRNAQKEMKIKLSIAQHIRLHTLKVLKGQNISETVEAALNEYFARHHGEADDAEGMS